MVGSGSMPSWKGLKQIQCRTQAKKLMISDLVENLTLSYCSVLHESLGNLTLYLSYYLLYNSLCLNKHWKLNSYFINLLYNSLANNIY